MSPNHSSGGLAPVSFTMVKILRYAALAMLVSGVLYYFWIMPPSLNPIADSRAAEALALVQTIRLWAIPQFSRR